MKTICEILGDEVYGKFCKSNQKRKQTILKVLVMEYKKNYIKVIR